MDTPSSHSSWIGSGVYTISEAARLTKVSQGRIRRWMKGYTFVRSGESRRSLPVFLSEYQPTERGTIALSFQDLVEVRFVSSFLDAGVNWRILREAHTRARDLLTNTHPFATQKFVTDGRTVLTAIGQKTLLDIVGNQFGFYRILETHLKQLEFDGNVTVRWWPMGRHRPVVIDGARSFGQPIVSKEGVPTAILHRACLAEKRADITEISAGSIERVASWFDVEKRSVRAAVEYELRLAA